MRRLLLIAVPALAACQAEPAITLTDATIVAGPRSAAVYATINNQCGADRLTAIEADGRMPIGLHLTSNDEGVVRMRSVDRLEVPSNGRLELKSGGAHGMAMGSFNAASAAPLTFRFERSAPISVDAAVTGPGGMEQHR